MMQDSKDKNIKWITQNGKRIPIKLYRVTGIIGKNNPGFVNEIESVLKKGVNAEIRYKLNGRIPTEDKVKALFKQAKEDTSIPWGFLEDGCFARAHTAAKKLIDKGYNVGKIFVMTDLENELSPKSNKNIKWWYHVAPLTVSSNGAYVIDPASSNKPMKIKEFVDNMWNGKGKIRVVISSADEYNPPPETNTRAKDFALIGGVGSLAIGARYAGSFKTLPYIAAGASMLGAAGYFIGKKADKKYNEMHDGSFSKKRFNANYDDAITTNKNYIELMGKMKSKKYVIGG